jgi:hypothetical protein
MTDVEKEKDVAVQPPKGRAAMLARYRGKNPEAGDDIDDEALWEYANNGHSELEGKYNQLNGANTRLAELVGKDPRLASVLSMLAGDNPKSLPYAVGTVYGKDFMDGDLDEFEAGYQENLKRLAESKKTQAEAEKNIGESISNIEKYAAENGLSEEQAKELYAGIMDFAENLLMGKIPAELVDLVYKGLNYEKDVQEAADTGFVEGKNEKVTATMKTKTDSSIPPSLGTGANTGKVNKARPPKKKGSFFDEVKDIE